MGADPYHDNGGWTGDQSEPANAAGAEQEPESIPEWNAHSKRGLAGSAANPEPDSNPESTTGSDRRRAAESGPIPDSIPGSNPDPSSGSAAEPVSIRESRLRTDATKQSPARKSKPLNLYKNNSELTMRGNI